MEPLTAGQQALADEATARAERIAQRYGRIFPQHEADIHSSAYWGAIRAAAHYKPDHERANTWDRWSALHIKGEIQEFLRSRQSNEMERLRADCSAEMERKSRGRADRPRKTLHRRPKPLDASEDIEDHRDYFRQVDADDEFAGLIRVLPRKQAEICRRVYAEGSTPAEAGRDLGLSEFRGCKIHQEAIERLRRRLGVMDDVA